MAIARATASLVAQMVSQSSRWMGGARRRGVERKLVDQNTRRGVDEFGTRRKQGY